MVTMESCVSWSDRSFLARTLGENDMDYRVGMSAMKVSTSALQGRLHRQVQCGAMRCIVVQDARWDQFPVYSPLFIRTRSWHLF